MSEVVAVKQCTRCRKVKPISEFHPRYDRADRRPQSHCKACHYQLTQAWRHRNRDKVNAVYRVYNGARRHGMTLLEYRAFIAKLPDACEVCGRNLHLHAGATRLASTICIDHDHETGQIRGVLCMNCNTALGLAADDPALLRKLARYLTKHTRRASRKSAIA